ncbi:MAG: hypothetical protein AB1730_26830 [Myxococcota bacterium]
MPLIDTERLARRLNRVPTAITKAARAGRFGDAAHRGPRGQWLFDWPRCAEIFRARTDPSRLGAKELPKAPQSVSVVVYESERGRLELPSATVARLEHLFASPEADELLTADDQEALNAILWIVGETTTQQEEPTP